MNILIIEDDNNKHEHIVQHIHHGYPGSLFTSKKSYQSGLRDLIKNSYDFVILDMSLPTYDIDPPREQGGPFRTFAGEEILFEIKRRSISHKVLIVTQFESFGEGETYITLPELTTKLLSKFPGLCLGAIYYNAFETSWKDEVCKIINKEFPGGGEK